MQLALVLGDRPISHAIGEVEQIEAETPAPLSSADFMNPRNPMLADHASISLTWILVRRGVAVHGRRAVDDLVGHLRLLGGADCTRID